MRGNGSLLGVEAQANTQTAPGIWTLNEVAEEVGDSSWPGQVSSLDLTVLVVSGGGGTFGGSNNNVGGGGAGGLKQETINNYLTGTTTVVTVGGGGVATQHLTLPTDVGGNGSGSSFGSFITTLGGGGGAGGGDNASSGGSGGGAKNGSAGAGTAGQGFAGAGGGASIGGGGGGAGGAGGSTPSGATGGLGVSSSITGGATFYASGGSGSRDSNAPVPANPGGGGTGATGNTSNRDGSAGTANTGGGGGGGNNSPLGYAGGSGVVIVRYPSAEPLASGGTITSYTSGSTTYQVHTFSSTGSFAFPAVSPPTLVGVGSITQTGSGTTITLNKPAGTQAGDLLVAFYTSDAHPASWTPESGWTEIIDTVPEGLVTTGSSYKVATSSEPSTYTFTCSGGASASGVVVAYRNAQFDVVGSVGIGNVLNVQTAPSITTTTNQCKLLAFFAEANGNRSWSNPTSGLSLISSDFTANGRPAWALYEDNSYYNGATGDKQATCSSGGNGCYLLSLKPA